MKLKYYMRGLGIGILVTTILLTIGKGTEFFTDEEIMERAEALGMVMKEDADTEEDRLTSLLDQIKPTTVGAPDKDGDTGNPDNPSNTDNTDNTENIDNADHTDNADNTEAGISDNTDNNADAEAVKPAEAEEPEDNITFTIVKGMSSEKVANLLVKVELIDNAREFNSYIVGSGKASVIRIGTYTLPASSSYEEIVKSITE